MYNQKVIIRAFRDLTIGHAATDVVRVAQTTPLTDFKDEAVPELDFECRSMIVRYIRLLKDQKWPFQICDEVKSVLEEYSEQTLAERIMIGWQPGAAKLILHGPGWADLGATLLPTAEKFGNSPGLYIDFLQIPSTEDIPSHIKAYGGMSAGVDGLYGRILQHNNVNFRKTHPSFHYEVRDSAGTASDIRIFATYRRDSDHLAGLVLLAEGFMIACFGLFEYPTFLKTMMLLKAPAVTGVRPDPFIGLNSEAGLRYNGWDAIGAELARDTRNYKKAMELITTGYPVSIKTRQLWGRSVTPQLKFDLMHEQIVNVSGTFQKTVPQLKNHDYAIIYIHLSTNQHSHHRPWYNYGTGDDILRRFGIWIQLGCGKGFWLQCIAPGDSQTVRDKQANKWRKVALVVVETYNIDD